MPNPTRIEINCETGEVAEIELTDAEVQELEDARVAAEAAKAIEDQAKADAEALKVSARAKLVAGQPLTAEEADTLIL